MNDVAAITPLPASLRDVPDWLLPNTPPLVIRDAADMALARELFAELDEQSKDWYRSRCSLFAAS